MADNTLNEKSIEKKLMSFNNSQESVQAVSLWIMHNRSQHQKIVDTWMKVLRKSEAKHKLTLFYLCNDVVQHAKRKKALYYLENFKDNLREAVHIVRELDNIKPNISRIFKIWEDRRTYDLKFIGELRRIMDSSSDASGGSSANATPASAMSPAVSYKPSKKPEPRSESSRDKRKREKMERKEERRKEEKRKEEKRKEEKRKEEKKKEEPPDAMDNNSSKYTGEFKTNKFIEEMTVLRTLEGDANLKAKQLAAMRIDATNMEAVKQLKDRSHGNEFCNQFEESCIKIEDYVAMLEKEMAKRRQVLALCEEAEAFYDEQYSEAKIVATAYKNFGARITNMKKRVDDMKKIIPATPSPVPSPSADAPSPGNTPPLQDMDDNDTVDMEIEEEAAAPVKQQEQDAGPPVHPAGGAYTAMVKSIAQPIASVTNITMREEDARESSEEPPPPEPPIEDFSNSITNTFQGSNILESRIASMLPNLAKGASSIGSQAPIIRGLQEAPEPKEPSPPAPEPIPEYVPPKSPREESPDDRSSTPVQDEPEEKSPSPARPKTPPSASKPPVTKKTNPIDFLSQLLTKTSNSSSSSNFLQSLSLLTNTVKNQYQKKKETEEKTPTEEASASAAPAIVVEHSSGYAAVPPPEPRTQTSSWSNWKTIVTPPQPPMPQVDPSAPPMITGVKSSEIGPRPPMPQRPPLPPDPFPGQPPTPQNFPRPPIGGQLPVSQSVGYRPPRPALQPFPPAITSPPAFPSMPVISQSFPNQPPVSSTSPGAAVPPGVRPGFNRPTSPGVAVPPPVRTGFNPLFPFGPMPSKDGPAPPPPQPVDTIRPPPPFQSQNSWEQQNTIRPPGNQSHVQGGYRGPPPNVSGPPPWRQETPPVSQPPASGYGNTIHTLSSRRPSWEHNRGSNVNPRENSWNREAPSPSVGGGYAHPWDQPDNYDDDDEETEVVEHLPRKPLPPTPKSILRNRSSSLREVIIIDESDDSNSGSRESPAPAPPQAPEGRPQGILKKPPLPGGGQRGAGPGADVQSEFIAKLKQKSGSNSNIPLPPPGGRQLTQVSMEEQGSGLNIPPPPPGGRQLAQVSMEEQGRGHNMPPPPPGGRQLTQVTMEEQGRGLNIPPPPPGGRQLTQVTMEEQGRGHNIPPPPPGSRQLTRVTMEEQDSSHNMPPPPPGGRQLTPVTMEEEGPDVASIDQGDIFESKPAGIDQEDIFESEPISTIGVISTNGRTASVKSDDMDLDSDEHDSNHEVKSENSWENTDEQLWQEERQGIVIHDFQQDRPIEPPREPDPFGRSEPPQPPQPPRPPHPHPHSQPYRFDSFQQREINNHPRPARFREEHFRGPAPPRRQFEPHRPRMPYYRY